MTDRKVKAAERNLGTTERTIETTESLPEMMDRKAKMDRLLKVTDT
ncbi:hypothetical protein [Lysinibacillus sphaericus]|nr:hypothetical protein [Lysinibacillus sphaericus]